MKKLLVILTLFIGLLSTSCSRYTTITSFEFNVLKRDNNLSKVKVKTKQDFTIDYVVKDTTVSRVKGNGKVVFETDVKSEIFVEKGTTGYFIEEDGNIYFEFNDEYYKKKIGRLPIKIEKEYFLIRTQNKGVIINTNFKIDSNNPEFSIKRKHIKKRV